jgi:hypothetical protein
MLSSTLIACTPSGNGDSTTEAPVVSNDPAESSTDAATTEAPNDERGFLKDGLPDKKFDDEFRLFTWSNQSYWEFDSNEETGNPIYDQIYYRKQHLKDKYGITIALTKENGDWDHRNSFIKKVEAFQNETGADAYHALGCYFPISGSMSIKGFFEDLTDKEYAPYIDLSKPWWPDDLLGTAKVNGAVYAVTGDITPTFIRNMALCHVNVSLLEEYNHGVDVYQLVKDKQWTYEKLAELTLNKVPEDSDKLGIAFGSAVSYDSVFYSTGMTFVENLDDGSIRLSNFASDEKFLDFYTYAYRLLADNADVELLDIAKGFSKSNVIVQFGSAAGVQTEYKNFNFDYACVPLPMYVTEEYTTQDRYYSIQSFWTTLYSINVNCPDYELSSFTIEALASYGYRWFTPTWFEDTFQNRILENTENAEMLELIRDSVVFDSARIFGTHINCYGAFRQAASNPDWVSYYNSKQEGWSNAINEINNKLG